MLQDCYSEHGMYVSDVAWSVDGIVASTSYDKTVGQTPPLAAWCLGRCRIFSFHMLVYTGIPLDESFFGFMVNLANQAASWRERSREILLRA